VVRQNTELFVPIVLTFPNLHNLLWTEIQVHTSKMQLLFIVRYKSGQWTSPEQVHLRKILGFQSHICVVFKVMVDNWLLTLWDILLVMQSKKMGLIGCPKMFVNNYQHKLHNSPEEQRPQVHLFFSSYNNQFLVDCVTQAYTLLKCSSYI